MHEINKPLVTTYYIIKDVEGNIQTYGSIEPNLVMTTGHPTLITFTEREAWEEALQNLGIDPGDELVTK